MKLWIPFAASAGALLAIASFVGAGWDAPPVASQQIGYRGTGMNQHRDIETEAALKVANVVPEAPWEADPVRRQGQDALPECAGAGRTVG